MQRNTSPIPSYEILLSFLRNFRQKPSRGYGEQKNPKKKTFAPARFPQAKLIMVRAEQNETEL